MYKLGVLGKNISYSQSPYIHQAFANHFGIDIQYEIFDISDDPLLFVDEFFAKGGHGLNITTPYKTIFSNSTNTPINLLIKNTNTTGYQVKNVDADGFFEDLRSKGLRSQDGYYTDRPQFENYKRVIDSAFSILIMGLGGAGLAIAQSNEMQRHVTNGGRGTNVRIWNRTYSKIQEVEKVWANGYFNKNTYQGDGGLKWPLAYNPLLENGGSGRLGFPEIDLLVSCTSKIDEQMLSIIKNIKWESYSGWEKTIYDINYNNKTNNQLSKVADEIGARFISGEGMLVEQAALSFKHWFNKEIPTSLKEEIKTRINNERL